MASWRALMIRPGAGIATAVVVTTACGDARHQEVPPTPPPATTTPGARTSAAPTTVAVAPSAGPVPGDDGLVTLDLGSAGEVWVGVTARAAAGATVTGDGGGGVLIVLAPGRPVVLSTAPGAIADQRLGATVAARATEGTITFDTDTPREIAYAIQLDDVDDNALRTRGFATTITLGPRSVACSYATARDDRELAAARAVCTSLARR